MSDKTGRTISIGEEDERQTISIGEIEDAHTISICNETIMTADDSSLPVFTSPNIQNNIVNSSKIFFK